MQALVVRETGWTILEYRQQPVDDVFDLVAHLNEEPPAYRILAWRYLPKPKTSRSRSANPAATDKEAMRELAKALGGSNPVPSHIRADFEWAQKQLAGMKKK